MAIDEPDAIDAAPAGPQRSGGWRTGGFVVSRGMTRRAALQRRKARVRGRNPPGRRCGIGDRGEAGFGQRSSQKRTCGSRAEQEQVQENEPCMTGTEGTTAGVREKKPFGFQAGEYRAEIPNPLARRRARRNCRRMADDWRRCLCSTCRRPARFGCNRCFDFADQSQLTCGDGAQPETAILSPAWTTHGAPVPSSEAGTKANIPSRTQRASAIPPSSTADFFAEIYDFCVAPETDASN